MNMSESRRPTLEERNPLLHDTILSPGTVNINVQGAFIADEVPSTTQGQPDGGAQHHTRDIRLPNHKAVVSHVALDIGGSLAKLVYFSREPDSKEVCISPGNHNSLRRKLRCEPLFQSDLGMLRRKR